MKSKNIFVEIEEFSLNFLDRKKSDGFTKKHKADLSDTGVVNDSNAAGLGDQLEDSFQKMYSKELDLDEGI